MREPGEDDELVQLGEVLAWPTDDAGRFVSLGDYADMLALGLVRIPQYEPSTSTCATAKRTYEEAALVRYEEQLDAAVVDEQRVRDEWLVVRDELAELKEMNMATDEDEAEMERKVLMLDAAQRRTRLIMDAIAHLSGGGRHADDET